MVWNLTVKNQAPPQMCRIHGPGKGVKKHERVTLEKENDAATCDICQENKAIMFCSEDRALICRRQALFWLLSDLTPPCPAAFNSLSQTLKPFFTCRTQHDHLLTR